MSATLKQIAERTGLSIPTVHQVLNGYNVRFSAETRRKVVEAAKALDYRPNLAARGLRAKKSFLLGVQFCAANDRFLAQFARGFQSICVNQSYTPILLTHEDAADGMVNLRTLLDRRVDGILINCGLDKLDAEANGRLLELGANGLVVVELLGQRIKSAPSITLDNAAGAAAATQGLLERGHRHVHLVIQDGIRQSEKSSSGTTPATDFAKSYERTMEAANLRPVVQTYRPTADGPPQESTYRAASVSVEAWLGHRDKPTAFVCYSVEAAEAIGHHRLAQERAENRIAVAVFDFARPRIPDSVDLIWLEVPAFDTGVTAATLMLQGVSGKPMRSVVLSPGYRADRN